MPYIVKRLVPVYNSGDKVPKKYLNLRKLVYVTTFKYLYKTIPQILIKEYGLSPNEHITIFWTKEIALPHFNRYRIKFRKVYSGSIVSIASDIRARIRDKSLKH